MLGSDTVAIKVSGYHNASLMLCSNNLRYSYVAPNASVLFSFSVTWVTKKMEIVILGSQL